MFPPWGPAASSVRALTIALALAYGCVLALAAGASGEGAPESTSSAPAQVPAPPNDALADAQPVGALPASLNGTTVGATVEAGEHEAACGPSTDNSVWYSLRLSHAQRVGLDLQAAGALDATVDVYHAVRSQLSSVACEQTEAQGKASLSFVASKNGLYDIRVAAVAGSQLAPFTLEVFLPTPAIRPPGAPLAAAGISGQVDRVQNINAAYSFTMHAGVSYMINLANETKGACVTGALFAPGTSSFGGEEEGEQSHGGLLRIECGGYRLFTPRPGKGGLYSFDITPASSRRGVQRFHLQVAPAGPAETAPGLALDNYARANGYLDGHSVQVLRLYRMEVTSHSNLTLRLTAPASAEFKLQLLSQGGEQIECQCNGSGSQTLTQQLQPGNYYAVVAEHNGTSGAYTLERESRTITSASISFSAARASAGQPLAIDVEVSPAVSGPVSVQIERFDPVFGWQFFSEAHVFADAGLASVPFTPPAVGLWRAKADYEGSLTASPSEVGHAYVLVS
jgi:hypothetical protein